MQQDPMKSNINENENENENGKNTKLLLEGLAKNSLRGEKRKAKVMKKQSNRLAARSSHLLDNFSDFLASRNVINRTSRYDLLVSDNNENQLLSEQVIFPETLSSTQSHHRFNRYGSQQSDQYFNQPLTYKYYDYLSDKKPGRVKSLVGALFSRKQNNKTSLLLTLLRAPIVLAALFSLILVATLMILYTMSFHHFNCHHHVTNQQQQQQQQQRQQQQLYHHINSRQLQQQQETGEREAVEFDGTSETNVSSDFSTLSKKLTKKNEKLVSNTVSSFPKVSSQETSVLSTRIEEEERSYERALTVHTECGSFVGSPEGQAIVFKGISYASPPIGPRRWARPRPVWQDPELCDPKQTKLALHSRIHCAQLSPVTRRFSGHEDCLYLDIFTPKLNDQVKKLPVMVYIHGGFLTFGSSGHGQVNWLKGRPSAKLASELNVVLVSFNYRLQALGFMTLVQLAQNNGPEGSEGNYGLWDQLTALNWIKRNIESFAGDSNNIVLFGPDSASALPLAVISQRQQLEEVESAVQEMDIKGEEGLKEFKKIEEKESSGGVKEKKIPKESSGNLVQKERENRKRADGIVDNLTIKQQKQQSKLWLDNQIDIDRQQEQQHVSLYSNRDLFRAIWLTNPTVYYKLPYEKASKHYQRLFLKQLPCLRFLAHTEVSNKYKISKNSIEEMTKKKSDGQNEREKRGKAAIKSLNRLHPPSNEMIECLMSLSSEQVVRHYLGEDDPSNRLDDQNSLPIHGIFADQFVTVDRELVQDSYPFSSSLAVIHPRKSTSKLLINSNNTTHYLDTKSIQETSSNSHYLKISKETASFSKQQDSNEDFLNSICKQKKNRLRCKMSLFHGKDLLLGSTAQAVEYWPCPRNLNQWNWEEFERYVSTSLNSFSRDTFREATEMYNVSPEKLSKHINSTMNPREVYLTMVSDIRQICPINELADSMLERHHNVHRYIVEASPSNQAVKGAFSPNLYTGTTSSSSSSPLKNPNIQKLNTHDDEDQDPSMSQYKPEFAYHTWDLFAFFGFEFDPYFVPQEEDLKFQSHIRQMVKRFVHKDQASSDNYSDSITPSATTTEESSNRYTLYTKNGTTMQVSKYKSEECKMWRKHIDRLYAWVS